MAVPAKSEGPPVPAEEALLQRFGGGDPALRVDQARADLVNLRNADKARETRVRGIFRRALALTPDVLGVNPVSVSVNHPRYENLKYVITRDFHDTEITTRDSEGAITDVQPVRVSRVTFATSSMQPGKNGVFEDVRPLFEIEGTVSRADDRREGELTGEYVRVPEIIVFGEDLDAAMEPIDTTKTDADGKERISVFGLFERGLGVEDGSAYRREVTRQHLRSRVRHAYYAIEGHVGDVVLRNDNESKRKALDDWLNLKEKEASVALAGIPVVAEVLPDEGVVDVIDTWTAARDDLEAAQIVAASSRMGSKTTLYDNEIKWLNGSDLVLSVIEAETDLIQFDATPSDRWQEWRDTDVEDLTSGADHVGDSPPIDVITTRATLNMARGLRKLREDISSGKVKPKKKETPTARPK